MKKELFISMTGLFFVLTSVLSAQAGLINYERRNKQPGQASAAAASNPIINMMRSQPSVSTRTERLYDTNRDGVLQESEIKEMFRGVVASVEQRGSFNISSDLLETFDTNRDGNISNYEAANIKRVVE